jgi:16S rRNA (cytosine1402-N4)-methyltransferase
MRMNPNKGLSAGEMLQKLDAKRLGEMLMENADEPRATLLGEALAGRAFQTTGELARAVRVALPHGGDEAQKQDTIRRVFQALRIAVNDVFSVLDTWLRSLPDALRAGGRVAVLTFHSGEDRRVKKAFQAGLLAEVYDAVSEEVIRATPGEVRENSRAAPAKLRWAVKLRRRRLKSEGNR